VSAYATPGDVRKALAPEDDTSGGTAASLSDSQLTNAIAEATNEIDARVQGAPFTTIPPVISSIARDIAAYFATLAYRKGNLLPPEHPVALRYAHAQALLTSAARGELDLTQDTEPVAGGDVAIVNQYEGSLFSLDSEGIGEGTRAMPWLMDSSWW
jgi:phage gp36-like protein